MTDSLLDEESVRREELAAHPRRAPEAVEYGFDDVTLLAREFVGRRVILDAVSTVLWSWMDGSSSTDELAHDVTDALGGSLEERQNQVVGLVQGLRNQGLLDGPIPEHLAPRKAFPGNDPESCLGQRLGLSRATLRELGDGDTSFRFGATDSRLVEELAEAVGARLPGPGNRETFIARTAPTRGRVRRTQFLFDGITNVLHTGRDVDACGEALRRTVGARIEIDRSSTWAEGAYFLTPAGATLLHPAIAHEATGALRPELETQSVSFGPSGLVEVLSPTSIRIPADPLAGMDSAYEVPLLAFVTPQGEGPHSVERFSLDIARTWTPESVQFFVSIAQQCHVCTIGQGWTGSEVIAALTASAYGRPHGSVSAT